MNKFAAALCALCTLLCAAACSQKSPDNNNPAVPKPKAFARIETYAPEYSAIDSVPVLVHVNKNATVHHIKSSSPYIYAANIIYPAYGNATLHLNIMLLPRPDSLRIAAAQDNRLERIGLNVGNQQARTTSVPNSNGIENIIVTTTSASPTPVQMLATDSRQLIVTATAFVDYTPSPLATDSLQPVLKALETDISQLASSLKITDIQP